MTSAVYTRYEVLRSFRNWRFVFLTLAFPLVLYLTVASENRHAVFNGVAFPLYFMAAMCTLGSMASVLSSAAIIATERQSGWTRQIRITPLSSRAYFRAKVLTAYLRALLTIALLCLAGLVLGVHLAGTEWLTFVGLLLVGIVPLAVLGILLGHLIRADAATLVVAGITTLLSLLGGVYGFQVAKSGVLFDIIKGLPSYWLVQAGKAAHGGGSWPPEGWIVLALWTAVLVPLALVVYRRDTQRV
jgi:ABC-2 type transport system permease protein